MRLCIFIITFIFPCLCTFGMPFRHLLSFLMIFLLVILLLPCLLKKKKRIFLRQNRNARKFLAFSSMQEFQEPLLEWQKASGWLANPLELNVFACITNAASANSFDASTGGVRVGQLGHIWVEVTWKYSRTAKAFCPVYDTSKWRRVHHNLYCHPCNHGIAATSGGGKMLCVDGS